MARRVQGFFAFCLPIMLVLLGCSSGAPASPTQPPATAKPAATAAAPSGATPAAQAPVPAATKPAEDRLQALYQAAKAEGEVDFWGPADPEELKPLLEAFSKKFPGIAVKHFEIQGEEFVPRAIAEAGQGKVSYDVAEGRMAVDAPLLERDLVQGYDDWTTIFKDLNPEAVLENGKMLVWYNLLYAVTYNTQLVKADEVPKTWEDLLDPKWKRKILMESRANTFGYLGLDWGEAKLNDYLTKLKAQEPVYVRGGTTVVEQNIAGVAPIGVGSYVHKVLQRKKDGAPIEWARVSPLGATSTSLFIPKKAPHPNAARLFAGWITSDEGQKIYTSEILNGPLYAGSPHPAAKDIEANKIKVLLETGKNYDLVNQLTVKSIAALGLK